MELLDAWKPNVDMYLIINQSQGRGHLGFKNQGQTINLIVINKQYSQAGTNCQKLIPDLWLKSNNIN